MNARPRSRLHGCTRIEQAGGSGVRDRGHVHGWGRCNFSTAVLEQCPQSLLVSRLPAPVWPDLGTSPSRRAPFPGPSSVSVGSRTRRCRFSVRAPMPTVPRGGAGDGARVTSASIARLRPRVLPQHARARRPASRQRSLRERERLHAVCPLRYRGRRSLRINPPQMLPTRKLPRAVR